MSNEPAFQSVPVQRALWESLEALLLHESKRLVEDIASTLRKDPKVLWNEIRKDKLQAYLVDCNEPTSERFLCQGLVHQTAVAQRCRKPVLFGTAYCPEHQGWTLPQPCEKKPVLRRVVTAEDEIYYLDDLTMTLYDQEYVRRGYKQGEKWIVFDVQDSTADS